MKIKALNVTAECEGDEGAQVEISRILDRYFVTILLRDGTSFKVISKNVRVVMPDGERVFRT
jgi:hypothetical protein